MVEVTSMSWDEFCKKFESESRDRLAARVIQEKRDEDIYKAVSDAMEQSGSPDPREIIKYRGPIF